MSTDRDGWLALGREAALDPDLPICDPHHHLFDNAQYTYLLEHVLQDTGCGHNVVRTVFVECSSKYRTDGPEALRPVGETTFVEDTVAPLAGGPPDIAAGIVGFADLTLGAGVAPVIEAHLAASPDRFRGIRHPAAWDASPEIGAYKSPPRGLLLDARFREGVACLGRYGLSFEASLYHPQLSELVDLAQSYPDVPIILNHTGVPLGIGPYAGQREAVFQVWKVGIAQVAACPNVAVKLGGLSMACCGMGWHEQARPPSSAEMAEAMAPYLLWCIEQFGVDRCMFESNFPVDRIASLYCVLWNAFKRVVSDLAPGERAALFHDTAARVYRLADHAP